MSPIPATEAVTGTGAPLTRFRRSLGLFDGIMLVAGSMIGSGIFLTSAEISRTVGGAGWMLLVWVAGGVMTVIGALSYGELASLYPRAGGQYVFLREAYNPLIAFLYGWAFFVVIECGTIAAVAVAFAKYLAYIFPAVGEGVSVFHAGAFDVSVAQLVAIALIVLLSFINSRGINKGRLIQGVFTVAKIAGLGLLVVAGLFAVRRAVISANLSSAWHGFHYDMVRTASNAVSFTGAVASHGMELAGLLGVAMVGSLFSSDAWNSVTLVAAEVKNPGKNVARSLLFGTLMVTVIYILVNFVYVAILPMHDIAFAPADRVAASASWFIFGETGAILIAVIILVSTFGCNNGLILSGARVYYALAEDGLFFPAAGRLNRRGVPAYGIWIQCAWASLLCLSGTYSDLLNYIISVVLIFYILTIAGIYLLRRRYPDAERSYKAPGYPVLPALYMVLAAFVCLCLFVYRPLYTWPGLGLVVLGIPLYLFIRARNKKTAAGQGAAGPHATIRP
jgi:APA family basic amino acid/polyamine antiporter